MADGTGSASRFSTTDLFARSAPCEFCDRAEHPTHSEERMIDLLDDRSPAFIDRMVDLMKQTPAGRRTLTAIKERL